VRARGRKENKRSCGRDRSGEYITTTEEPLVFFIFWEQRGAIGVEMLLHMQESPTSIGLNLFDTLHRP
jgi:hypothetical protein